MKQPNVLIATAPGIPEREVAALRAHLTEALEDVEYQIVVNYPCSFDWYDRDELCIGALQFHGASAEEAQKLADQIRTDAVVVIPVRWSHTSLYGGR